MEILLMFDGLWCGVRGTLDDLDDPERGDTVRHPFFQNVLSVLITVLRFPSIDYCVLMCFAAVWTYFYFMFPFICSRSFELLILGIPGFLLLLTNVDFNNHWPMKMEIITRSKESLRAGYYCTPYCNWRLAFFLGREPQLLGVFQQVNKKDWIDEPPNIEPFVHFGWRAGCEGELTHITHAFFFSQNWGAPFHQWFPQDMKNLDDLWWFGVQHRNPRIFTGDSQLAGYHNGEIDASPFRQQGTTLSGGGAGFVGAQLLLWSTRTALRRWARPALFLGSWLPSGVMCVWK